MDIFRNDAFSMVSLLGAIDDVDYKPQFLGSLNIFQGKPQRLRTVAIESRDNALSLIQTTQIGAPLIQQSSAGRVLRNFNTFRIAKGDRMMADEIQGIRAFGSETEVMQAQAEVARRLATLTAEVELTWEHMRLGAVQGILTDADDSVLVNFFTEFGVAQPAEVDINFGALVAGELRPAIESIVRDIVRAAKGAFVVGSRIVALVGDDFWDALVNHVEVRAGYLNWEAAAALREGTVFSTFRYAGVEWINYRGTDDGTTVAIASDEAKFFPVAPGIFQVAWAPAEFIDTVNQPGVPIRPLTLQDPSGRQAWVDVEVYSYPLFVCTRPLTLRSARIAT